MMKSGGQGWAIYFIAEEYDPKLAEITSRTVFGHEDTGEKWIREKLGQEQARVLNHDPALPLTVVITETTGAGRYFELQSEGEEILGYYLSPARYYP